MNFPIRLANINDVPLLENVERSAFEAFAILPDYGNEGRTIPPQLLYEMAASKNLWVAVDKEDRAVGFIGCRMMDDSLYVHEISVALNFQKQGIGRRLMNTVINEAAKRGSSGITLTTARHVQWNMPFYKTLGFFEITDGHKWPNLYGQLQKEIAEGANAFTRCAMVKTF